MKPINNVIIAFKLRSRCIKFVDDINKLIYDIDVYTQDKLIDLVLNTLETQFKKEKEKK